MIQAPRSGQPWTSPAPQGADTSQAAPQTRRQGCLKHMTPGHSPSTTAVQVRISAAAQGYPRNRRVLDNSRGWRYRQQPLASLQGIARLEQRQQGRVSYY